MHGWLVVLFLTISSTNALRTFDPSAPYYGPRLAPGDCLIARAGDWGLGSQIVHLVHAVVNVGKTKLFWDFGDSPYQCCPVNETCSNNGWSTLFDGPVPTSLPDVHNANDTAASFLDPRTNQQIECMRWGLLEVADFNHFLYNASAFGCHSLCESLLEIWRPSPTIGLIIDYEMGTLRVYPRPHIAIQVRGGDKIGDEVNPYVLDKTIETMALDIRNHNGTCIILGDDFNLGQEAIRLAQKHLNCFVINRLEPGYAHDQHKFNSQTRISRCLRTKRLLVDIEMLAQADNSISLVISNVGRIATLLQYCRKGVTNMLDWEGRDVLKEACNPF